MAVRITIVADYNPAWETHRYTEAALQHSAEHLGVDVQATWVHTDDITPGIVLDSDGVWIGPGACQNPQNVVEAVHYARTKGIPCIGTCGGFQHMVLEYARNEAGFPYAAHEEYDPKASRLIISKLQCSLRGREMLLSLAPGSRTSQCYGTTEAREKYYCSYGINPEYVPALKLQTADAEAGAGVGTATQLRAAGSDAEGEVRVIEVPAHPFYLGTLYVPQASSTPARPHPLITGFLKAALPVTKEEALQFLRDHQPLPPDSAIDQITLCRFDNIRKYFEKEPDPACIPLFLHSFGDKYSSGFGVYQLLDGVFMKFSKAQMLPHLLNALEHGSDSVKFWTLQNAIGFPDEAFIPAATLLLQHPHSDIRSCTAYLLALIGSPKARQILESALTTEQDTEIMKQIRETLQECPRDASF